jgi:hypothetical protein
VRARGGSRIAGYRSVRARGGSRIGDGGGDEMRWEWIFRGVLGCDLKSEGELSLHWKHGGYFSDFGGFFTDFDENDHFLTLIFPFFAFFPFLMTVYSRRETHPDVLLIRKRL